MLWVSGFCTCWGLIVLLPRLCFILRLDENTLSCHPCVLLAFDVLQTAKTFSRMKILNESICYKVEANECFWICIWWVIVIRSSCSYFESRVFHMLEWFFLNLMVFSYHQIPGVPCLPLATKPELRGTDLMNLIGRGSIWRSKNRWVRRFLTSWLFLCH